MAAISTCEECGGFALTDGTMPTGETIYLCTECDQRYFVLIQRVTIN